MVKDLAPAMDPNRGTGRTARQLRSLVGVQGAALYVCPHRQAITYTVRLALHLGVGGTGQRSSKQGQIGPVRFCTPSDLDGGGYRFKGHRFSKIAVDHAAQLTEEQRYVLRVMDVDNKTTK